MSMRNQILREQIMRMKVYGRDSEGRKHTDASILTEIAEYACLEFPTAGPKRKRMIEAFRRFCRAETNSRFYSDAAFIYFTDPTISAIEPGALLSGDFSEEAAGALAKFLDVDIDHSERKNRESHPEIWLQGLFCRDSDIVICLVENSPSAWRVEVKTVGRTQGKIDLYVGFIVDPGDQNSMHAVLLRNVESGSTAPLLFDFLCSSPGDTKEAVVFSLAHKSYQVGRITRTIEGLHASPVPSENLVHRVGSLTNSQLAQNWIFARKVCYTDIVSCPNEKVAGTLTLGGLGFLTTGTRELFDKKELMKTETPENILAEAIRNIHEPTPIDLIDKIQDINHVDPIVGRPLLHVAVAHNDRDAVRRIMSREDVDLTLVDKDGKQAWNWCFATSGQPNLVLARYLLRYTKMQEERKGCLPPVGWPMTPEPQ